MEPEKSLVRIPTKLKEKVKKIAKKNGRLLEGQLEVTIKKGLENDDLA